MPNNAVDLRAADRDVEMAWFVNRPTSVPPEDVRSYMAQGVWTSPNPEAHRETLAQVRPGDRIACKSVTTQLRDLPFVTVDRVASVMTIYGTGTVRSVNADEGRIDVEWTAYDEWRPWYFWTGLRSVWRVDASTWRGRQLLDVAFGDAAQDIERFLQEPYWQERYARLPEFTWIPFYQEFATRLAGYRDRRRELADLIVELAETERYLRTFSIDRYPDGNEGPITDIDPFTVMATFNRGTRDENRIRVAQVLGDALGVTAPLPTDFDGVPLVSNQNSWFINFAESRQPGDVDALWRVFIAAQDLADRDAADARTEFIEAFDDAQQVSGVWWNLTQGLYWARPHSFPTLEGRSRPFIANHFSLEVTPGGEAYLRIIDELSEKFDDEDVLITSFPLLSYAAWSIEASGVTPHTVAGFAQWAIELDQSYDLEEREHNSKRLTAETLRRARHELLRGSSTWIDTFTEALGQAGSLMPPLFKADIIKALRANPEGWASTLAEFWDAPGTSGWGSLYEGLRERLGRAYPGSATSFGALLMLGVDVENNAPYAANRTHRWYELTDFPGPADNSSPTDRYETFLRFLDALRAEITAQTSQTVSRLEAEGMAVSVTESAPHPDWDRRTTEAFLRFRGAEHTPARAWLVRSRQVPVHHWQDRHIISLRAEFLGHVPAGAESPEVREAVEARYPQADYPERQSMAVAFHAFLTRMQPDDYVVALDGTSLHIGRIASGPTYSSDDGKNTMQRNVEWLRSFPTDSLPTRMEGFLHQPGSVVEITEAAAELETLLQTPAGDWQPEDTKEMDAPAMFRAMTERVADALNMPISFLQEVSDLLAERRQIILYGPPGTGKTYLALTLAEHLAGEDHPERAQLVQFHPSYAYEDFFEGFRPERTASGQVSFEIKPGPLRRIAQEARNEPSKPFFLIIDELNRANLAKVFGELYFLLEYRDQSVQLQYSDQAFELPKNLYFIGTMNTADRSVALLDAAMRRRFAFIELHPDEPPVNQVLETFLGTTGREDDERVRLLESLNAAIDDRDRDFKIGPSYLMRPEAGTKQGLERVWRFDILPLLQEHYYGQMSPTQITGKFGLAALRERSENPALAESPELTDRP